MSSELDLTNGEWFAFQAIPEQGHSHRQWIDDRIAERVAALTARAELAEFEARRNAAYANVARGHVEALLKAKEEARERVLAAEAKVAAVREALEHLTFVADDKYGDLAASQYYGDSELEAVATKSITRALDGDDHHTPETETTP